MGRFAKWWKSVRSRRPINLRYVWTMDDFDQFLNADNGSSRQSDIFVANCGSQHWFFRLWARHQEGDRRYLRLGLQLVRGPSASIKLDTFEVGVLDSDKSQFYVKDRRSNYRLVSGNASFCPTAAGLNLCALEGDTLIHQGVLSNNAVHVYVLLTFKIPKLAVTKPKLAASSIGFKLWEQRRATGDLDLVSAQDQTHVPCHWSVICSLSSICPKRLKEGLIDGVSGAELEELVRLIYTQTLDQKHLNMLSVIERHSNRFSLDLKPLQSQLSNRLTRANAASYLLLAHKSKLPNLKRSAALLVLDSYKHIENIDKENWKEITADKQLIKYLIETKINNSNKVEL